MSPLPTVPPLLPIERQARCGQLLRWLAEAATAELGWLPSHDAAYANHAQLVIEQGAWYTLAPDQPLRLASEGYCFANCAQAALSPDIDLHYVEGFALMDDGIIHHAWLAEGAQAIDPTIRWTRDAVLLGVRVPTLALAAHWRNCGGASFLLDAYHDYPALRVPYRAWSQELVALLQRLHVDHCQRELEAGRARQRPDGSIWHAEHLPAEEWAAPPVSRRRR